MDLADLDLSKGADAGAEMTVVHPITGEPLDMKITVVGSESSRLREEMKRRARQELARRKPAKFDIDEAELRASELLAACTLSWVGVKEKGVELECTYENATRVYLKYGWLRKQIDEFASDRANFFVA